MTLSVAVRIPNAKNPARFCNCHCSKVARDCRIINGLWSQLNRKNFPGWAGRAADEVWPEKKGRVARTNLATKSVVGETGQVEKWKKARFLVHRCVTWAVSDGDSLPGGSDERMPTTGLGVQIHAPSQIVWIKSFTMTAAFWLRFFHGDVMFGSPQADVSHQGLHIGDFHDAIAAERIDAPQMRISPSPT